MIVKFLKKYVGALVVLAVIILPFLQIGISNFTDAVWWYIFGMSVVLLLFIYQANYKK